MAISALHVKPIAGHIQGDDIPGEKIFQHWIEAFANCVFNLESPGIRFLSMKLVDALENHGRLVYRRSPDRKKAMSQSASKAGSAEALKLSADRTPCPTHSAARVNRLNDETGSQSFVACVTTTCDSALARCAGNVTYLD